MKKVFYVIALLLGLVGILLIFTGVDVAREASNTDQTIMASTRLITGFLSFGFGGIIAAIIHNKNSK